MFVRLYFNPLRPNSDLSQTSHCNIKGLSVREVMRIENMITHVKFYLYYKRRICNLIPGLKGLIYKLL